MHRWQPTRPRPSLLRRSLARMRGGCSLGVWLLAIAGAYTLSQASARPTAVRGLVDAESAIVRSPSAARLLTLAVGPHQEVAVGAVLAQLDDHQVRLRLHEATLELRRLQAELRSSEAEFEQRHALIASQFRLDTQVEQRRLVSAVEDAQLEALAIRAELEETRVRLLGANTETERIAALVSQQVLGEPELVKARTERDALSKRAEELTNLLAEQRARTLAAEQRLKDFAPTQAAGSDLELAMAPHRLAIELQAAALDRIAQEASNLTLKAPMAGRVVALTAQPGEWVREGAELLRIANPLPRTIRAYVDASTVDMIQAARTAKCWRLRNQALGDRAVLSISPIAVRLPARLWRDPSQEEWGYEVLLAASGEEAPGEEVRVDFR